MWSATASGTAIVAVRTPNEIVIAADGRATHIDGRPPETACKIVRVGKVYFATTAFEWRAYAVDPYANARKASLPKRKISDIADSFAELEKAELTRALPEMKRNSPDAYQFVHGHPLEAMFVGMEGGSPVWAGIVFWDTETFGATSVASSKFSCPGQCTDGSFLFMGARTAVGKARERNPRLLTGDPEKVAGSLIEIEINGEPDYAGGPVSLLRLDKEGAHWTRPGACHVVKTAERPNAG